MNEKLKAQGEISKPREIHLEQYWDIVRRRKWLVAVLTLVVLSTVALKTYTTKPTYTARGTLLIDKEPGLLTFQDTFPMDYFDLEYNLQTKYKLLQSRGLADRVVERLKLYDHKEFVGSPEKGKPRPTKDDPVFRQGLVSAFLGKLKISPVRLTKLVEVSFNAHDPKIAADSVNGLFESFIDMSIEQKSATSDQATEFLTQQIASIKSEVGEKERALQSYGVQKNIVILSDKETTIVDKLSTLNKALTDAQIERVRAETYYAEIKNASPNFIPEAVSNPLIQKLRGDYVQMSREYEKKKETFGPDYPEMQRLKAELESARDLLINETQNLIKASYSEFQAALKKEKSLEAVFNKQREDAFTLNSNAIVYNSLKIEIENKKSLLEILLKRQSETDVTARLRGLRTADVRVVDKADLPGAPSSPNKKLNMILGLLIGLTTGLGLAFLFEYLDSSVKSVEDVEKYSGLPALGIIPVFNSNGHQRGYGYGYGDGPRDSRRNKKSKKKGNESSLLEIPAPEAKNDENAEPAIKSLDLIPHYSPKSNFSESYRNIRTALLLTATDSQNRAIVVSSPFPSEGKTSTVCNLAATLAQTGKNILLIDADLRKPRVHKIFNIQNINGLTNYLTSSIKLEDVIKPTPVKRLYLVNSGPVPPNPAELLGSEKMAKFVKRMRENFYYVFLDSPPLLAVSDALVLGPVVDGLILVIWGGKTPGDALRKSKKKLELMNIKSPGVIINRMSHEEQRDYYMHYYYQHYGER